MGQSPSGWDMGLTAPSSPQRASEPPQSQETGLCLPLRFHIPSAPGREAQGAEPGGLAQALTQLSVGEPLRSMSPDRATKTSPQQPPRWPTRSPTPPWTSIRPRGPSTSSSLASEQRGPSVPPGGASVPDVLNFPGKDNWHLLRDAAPWGSLTQSRAPFLCLKFPCLKLEMVRQNLFSRERWLVSFEIIVPPKGH